LVFKITQSTHYYNQKKPLQKKGKLVESIIPKLPIQQLPTWKKVVYFYNNNQTNQKPQSKLVESIFPFNNNQHEKVEIPSTTTTKQTKNHNPNKK